MKGNNNQIWLSLGRYEPSSPSTKELYDLNIFIYKFAPNDLTLTQICSWKIANQNCAVIYRFVSSGKKVYSIDPTSPILSLLIELLGIEQ